MPRLPCFSALLQQELHSQHRFPAPEIPATRVVDPSKIPPANQSIQRLAADERALCDGCWLGLQAAGLDLYAAEHFQPFVGRDPECVRAALVVLAAAFHDFQRAVDAAVVVLAIQDNYGVREELGRFQFRMTAVGYR